MYSLTFSARGKHDLVWSPDGRSTALRLVDPPLETDDTMAWPTMAEIVFKLLTVDDDAKALAPMAHYVREEAWDRWLQTAGELVGPGYTTAVLGVTIEHLEKAFASASCLQKAAMTLSAADPVAAQADGTVLTAAIGGAALSPAEAAAAIKYNEEYEEVCFLDNVTFGELCSEGEGADAWARLAAALGSHVTRACRHAHNFVAMVRRIKAAIRFKEGVDAATENLDDESYAFGLVSFLKETAPRGPLRVFAGAPGGAAARSNVRAELQAWSSSGAGEVLALEARRVRERITSVLP